MDDRSLVNVLRIWRLIAQHGKANDNGISFIRKLSGSGASDTSIIKIASCLLEQTIIATTVINNSQLSEEAKAGVRQSIGLLSKHFSLDGLHSQFSDLKPAEAASIANLVILISAAGIKESNLESEDIHSLSTEINEVSALFNDPEIDPAVREIAQRHLFILSQMIENISTLGLEGAISEYFSLIFMIRRADIGASKKSTEKTSPLWERIEKWAKRIESLDKVVNAGAKFIGHADKVAGFLDHIPG